MAGQLHDGSRAAFLVRASSLCEALKAAEVFIQADRASIVEGGCVLEPGTLAPKLETMDADTAAYVAAHHDPLLAQIAAAIARAEGGADD